MKKINKKTMLIVILALLSFVIVLFKLFSISIFGFLKNNNTQVINEQQKQIEVLKTEIENLKNVNNVNTKKDLSNDRISLNNEVTQKMNFCRAETVFSDGYGKLPYYPQEGMKEYVNSLINLNASMQWLNAVRQVLIGYKEKAIDSYESSLYSYYGDTPWSPEQLDSLDESFSSLFDQSINYYDSWIHIVNNIILDKQKDGCIDGKNYYDYI